MAESIGRATPQPVDALEQRLRGLTDAVRDLAADARRLAQAEHHAALTAYRSVRDSVDARGEPAGQEAVERAVAQAVNEAAPVLEQLVEQLAPGLAGVPPGDERWRPREFVAARTSPDVRIGQLVMPAASAVEPLPVVVPLLGTAGWAVTADRRDSAHRLMQSVALRQVASAEPFRVRVNAFDPKLTGAMGLLGHLTTRSLQLVPKTLHRPADLHTMLAALVEVSSSRAARLAQAGHGRFEDLVRETGRVTDPYRLVLLFDYPAGVDAEAQRDLVRLAATAADRGICFLVHHDPNIQPERDVDPTELLSLLDVISIAGDEAEVARLPDVQVQLDPAIDAKTAAVVCDLVAGLAERAVLPSIDFMGTLPEPSDWWRPVDDELNTIVGFDDRSPAVIRLRSGNPALPHVLIGGAVGQGKSNLLLVLIHGLAARYSPADLEMYLLDFKHGVEFAALGPAPGREYWLPHARVLGIHSDRAFGLAVLRYLSDELRRRSELFKARGLADIAEFPANTERPPRLLVVLDEFQVLLENDDDLADEAIRLLERLARLGRAYGVHLVLATQTIEGVSRLTMRRDSIFGQVPHRIALKTTPTDSQAILRTGNTAAAELQFRGEAILNQNFGSSDDNQRTLVSFADKDQLANVRRELFAKAGATMPPRIFHLGEAARLTDLRLAHAGGNTSGSLAAWAGLPIAVTEQPVTVEVRQEPGAGVLVLGDGPTDALGVLTGLAISAATADTEVLPRFVLIDGTPSDVSTREAKAALVQALTLLGCEVMIADRPDVVHERLFGLRDAIRDGQIERPTYVLGVGLHALPRMKLHVEGRFESPADALTDIVRDGPAAGMVTFGWWNRLHSCTDQLGYNRANVTTHLFLRHPQDGVRSVCGPLIRWGSEPHRGLLWDGITPEPVTVVPFAPLHLTDVDQLLKRVSP